MKISKGELTCLIITIFSFVLAGFLYPSMPEKMATHWDAVGQINGHSTRFVGLFLMPILSAVFWVIFLVVPKIDPKSANIQKFRKHFDEFVVALFLFLLYIYLISIFINLGYDLSMPRAMALGFAGLLYAIGRVVKVAEPNWSIGIRTPWTLSNDKVWYATHKIGATVFQTCAFISLIAFFIPQYTFALIIIPLFVGMIGTVIKSYFLFKKTK